MGFGTWIRLRDHQGKRGNEHAHHPQVCPASVQPPPTAPLPRPCPGQPLVWFPLLQNRFRLRESRMREAPSVCSCLASFTQRNYVESFPCSRACP